MLAVYPGSFDPVTNGHVDIARRAARLFDRLIIAVYDAPPKRLLFTTEERVAMFRDALAGLSDVEVRPYRGLTIDYLRAVGARVIVRGLRAISDFELEYEMALMNRKLMPEAEVACLMTSAEHAFLSSSVVKEIASVGGNVGHLVPSHVAAALDRAYARVSG